MSGVVNRKPTKPKTDIANAFTMILRMIATTIILFNVILNVFILMLVSCTYANSGILLAVS